MSHHFARRVLACCGLLLLLSASVHGSDSIRVQADGRELRFDTPPQVVSGRALVPLRAIFEALGAEVAWDGATSTVSARSGAHTVVLQIGSTRAMVGGRPVQMDTPARILNGRTLVPLRFVAEALGARVDWDASTQTANIIRATTPEGLAHPIYPATDAAPTLSFSWGGGKPGMEPGIAVVAQFGQWRNGGGWFKAGFTPGTGIALYVSASNRPYYSATGGTLIAVRRSGDQSGTIVIRYGRRYAVVHRYVDGIPAHLQEGQTIGPGTLLGYMGQTGAFYAWAVELIELQADGSARSIPPFDYFDAVSVGILDRARQSAANPIASWTVDGRSLRDGWPALVGDWRWWADPALLGYQGPAGSDLATFLANRNLTWMLAGSPASPPATVVAARSGAAGPTAPPTASPSAPPAAPTVPWPWVDGVMVQPLPPNAAKVRLVLPAPLDRFTFITDPTGWGLGGFGLHAGGHVEGLDHIWLSVLEGTKVGSWADGVVERIDRSGDEWHMTIDYGGGLKGWHGEVETTLVKVGDRVKAGQPVATGKSFKKGTESAEFGLIDANRAGADDASSINGWVSPFDYLRTEDQLAFVAAYRRSIVEPYLAKGRLAGYIGPWEPYLTNPAVIHSGFKGRLPGEWVLTEPGATGADADLLTLLEVDNPYFKGRRVESWRKDVDPGPLSGTWEADYAAGHVRFESRGTTFYGIFELDESGPRAELKLEYQKGSYPAMFSERAAQYTARSKLPIGEDPQLKKTPAPAATTAATATPTSAATSAAAWAPRAGALALPIDIAAAFDPATRTQGDVNFRSPVIFSPFAEQVRDAGGGMKTLPDIEFHVRAGTRVRTSAAGRVRVIRNPDSPDWEVHLTLPGDVYYLAYDHLTDLLVQDGDTVTSGQAIGRAVAGRGEGNAWFEWGLREGRSQGVRSYCAWNYLDSMGQDRVLSVIRNMISQRLRNVDIPCLAQFLD